MGNARDRVPGAGERAVGLFSTLVVLAFALVLIAVGVLFIGLGLSRQGLLSPWTFVPLGLVCVALGVALGCSPFVKRRTPDPAAVVVGTVSTTGVSAIGTNAVSVPIDPPDLCSTTPRPASSWGVLVRILNRDERFGLGIVGGFVATFLCAAPLFSLILAWPYLVDGRWVQGRVVAKNQLRGRGGAAAGFVVLAHGGGRNRRHFFVDYEFTDEGGRLRRGHDSIDSGDWEGLNIGDPVSVRYVAANPDRSIVWLGLRFGHVILPIVGIAGLFMVWSTTCVLWRTIAEAWRRVGVLRRGPLVVGIVAEFERQPGYATEVGYRFLQRESFADVPVERTGRDVIRGPLVERLARGLAIPVVIDPQDAERSLIDAARARTEEFEELVVAWTESRAATA